MRFGFAIGGLAVLVAGAAVAQTPVDISRSVYVEHIANGARAIEPATTLRKGDKVVLVVEWRAEAPGRGFVISSPIPRDLAFQRAGSDEVEVSTDGGRNWGRIGAMKIAENGQSRLASVEDVTDLRWRVPPAATAQGRGMLTYSAIVR
jgi:hypothetical protein